MKETPFPHRIPSLVHLFICATAFGLQAVTIHISEPHRFFSSTISFFCKVYCWRRAKSNTLQIKKENGIMAADVMLEQIEGGKMMEESMKDYEKEIERSFREIHEGDIVSGTVIEIQSHIFL